MSLMTIYYINETSIFNSQISEGRCIYGSKIANQPTQCMYILVAVCFHNFINGQSRIPAEANNYIQATGNATNRDQDPYMWCSMKFLIR
jgi:hypothetical protein